MKVLFFAPSTYGFFKHIKCAMEEKNHKVDYIDELPFCGSSFLRRIFMKLPLGIKVDIVRKYVLHELSRLRNNYDLVFVIRACFFDGALIEQLRAIMNNSTFVLYQWDSSKNLYFLRDQVKLFDYVFSFDGSDCDKYGLIHKPLFFNLLHEGLSSKKHTIKYDYSFIGTDHSDRYIFLKEFKEVNDKNFVGHVSLLRSKVSYLYNKFILPKSSLREAVPEDFSFLPVGENEVVERLCASQAVLDISQPDQVGLTIRTFEALGLKKKLITTNKNIERYDFFNENNILVIDREHLDIPKSFFETPYKDIDESVRRNYLVSNWVEGFFCV